MKQNYWKMACMTAVGTLLLTAGAQSVSAAGTTDIMKTQQAGKVVGTVTDGTEPIIGASVRVKGSNVGTVTDMDGNFQLNVAAGTELIITYIGYKEVTVKAQNGMKVVMQEERTTPPVS